MNTKHILTALCGLSVALHAQTPPLTPSGPPTDPTTAMKSLNQVEARTIIDSLPFTISQPGSYYLTSNLEFTAASGDAITVNASNVTIDLNGFTLSSTAVVTGSGIFIGASVTGVAVTNGAIVGTTTVNPAIPSSSPGGFDFGVNGSALSSSCRFTKLVIKGCRSDGLHSPGYSMIEEVTLRDNGGYGVAAVRCSVSRCVANSNASDGIANVLGVVTDSTTSNNGGNGIYAGTVQNVFSELNGTTGIYAQTISNSTSRQNGGVGISGECVSNCVATNNGNHGISAPDGVVTGCKASSNGSFGISAANGVVTSCLVRGNSGIDILVTDGTRTGNYPAP
jgi:hypothetical protein